MKRKLITALLVVSMALPVSPVFADELLDRIVALEQQVAELQAEVDTLKDETVNEDIKGVEVRLTVLVDGSIVLCCFLLCIIVR